MPKNKLSDSEDLSSADEKPTTKKSKKPAPKKKKADTSDSDSGPEDRGPQKKPAPAASGKKSAGKGEGEGSWCLEGMRFVKVDEFKGRVFVNIREFYEKNGELLPGKKGISLSASQWRKLVSLTDDINAHLEKF